jgi:putative transposase
MSRYSPPEGQIVQAFSFMLDLTPEQSREIARFFGARRLAFNSTIATIAADLEKYRETAETTIPPTFYAMRKRWNAEKRKLCVNAETGEQWWPAISKEVFTNGVKDATDAYWRWQQSRTGKIARQL